MAQLNDLLVLGNTSLIGDVNLSSNLTITGLIEGKIKSTLISSNGTKYLLFSETTSGGVNLKLHEDVYYYYGGTYSSLNVGKTTTNGILTLWKSGLKTDIKSSATAARTITLPDKDGTLAMQTTWNDFIHSGNEFTFASPGYGSSSTNGAYIWLNYRTASGDSDGNINGYKFGNGKKTMEGVTVETFAFKGKKYRLTDKANNDYSALYDNGTNLWIGAESTAAKHHIGGTYISAGHSGTAGNETIYISVPNAANNNGANYGVFHTGNYKDLIVSNGLNAPITITNTTSKPAAKTDLPILKVKYQNSGGSYYTADVISAIGTGETGTTVNNACIRMGSTSGSLALTAGECGKNMITKHGLTNTENIYLLADADVQFYVGCANDAASSTNALNITSTKIEPKVDIVLPNNKGIIQHQNSSSNYTVPIKWLQGGVSEATYDPQIGHHTTGDTDGAIILLPYSTNTSPWNGSDGLYIGKNSLKWNGYSVLTSKSAVTIAQGGTGATSASAARTNLGVPPTNHASTATTYGVGDSTKYGHVILYNAADCTSYTSDSGGACTPAAVKKAVGLFDPKPHNHSTSNITRGTFGVARGGTGRATYATTNYAGNQYRASKIQNTVPTSIDNGCIVYVYSDTTTL